MAAPVDEAAAEVLDEFADEVMTCQLPGSGRTMPVRRPLLRRDAGFPFETAAGRK
jgi:hypothetical protein